MVRRLRSTKLSRVRIVVAGHLAAEVVPEAEDPPVVEASEADATGGEVQVAGPAAVAVAVAAGAHIKHGAFRKLFFEGPVSTRLLPPAALAFVLLQRH